jgi:2-polyprenyl-3-methyl-5-hydroxy-6-metoxy-1,4-benzoquinol methylase
MPQKADIQKQAFSDKMTAVLNYGALNLAMGIGYRTRLFDIMDTFNTPETAASIAEKSGLSTRYVTEWLGVMVCGDIVELTTADNSDDRFLLPKAHADLLTRRAGNSNLGVYTQEIPLLTTCAMEAVVNGFHTGNGVDYDHYPKFQHFMTQLADAKHSRVLVETFLPSVADGRIVRRLMSGIRVCDIGCGEGLAITLMARAFPESEFVGIDISEAAIQKAAASAAKHGISNGRFMQLDAAALTESHQWAAYFDYITAFDAIHDQKRPLHALKGVYTLLKPDGLFSMVDIAASSILGENRNHPMGAFLYTVSLMHCMPVGLADGGAGLGMMWGHQQAKKMLHSAGFRHVAVEDIPDDPFNYHFLCRK